MVQYFTKMKDISFALLTSAYEESILIRAREMDDADEKGFIAAQQELYQYFSEVFFRTSGAVLAVWNHDNAYKAVLRLEEYRDGLLLSGLETAPGERGKGYATALLNGTLADMKKSGVRVIYTHVFKSNAASLRVHEKCGFTVLSDSASFIDGSFSNRAYTLCCHLS